MKVVLLSLCLLSPLSAFADIVVPTRTIRPKEIIAETDLQTKPGDVAGAARSLEQLVGKEARTALYPGRPIRPSDVGPPAIVDRNDLVTLKFSRNGLTIAAEGRALGRGAAGERIRVMNLSSRTTVSGEIQPDGQIEVN